ncbi:MAG: VCBS repeat-containing protein, partial [Verrucomicrobiales bacterium]|nr:VCBS repeat-containing protein [Verrucomicrobiales bacterium]
YLMLGNGDGTLQKGQLVTGPNTLLAVADFTGDGQPDLLSYDTLPNSANVLAVRPSNGDGTFGAEIITRSDRTFTFSGEARPGDFNGDGKLDLLVVSFAGGGLGIWLNDGTGRFTLGSSNTGTLTRWEFQALSDFNRDGKLDVLMNDRTGDIGTYKLIVVPGDGAGKLGAPLAPTPFPGTYNSRAISADINRDGTADVITPGRFPNQLQEARVSLGNGDGTFQPHVSFFGNNAESNTAVTVADFNRDGLIDLLVGQSLLLQRSR